MTTSTVTLLWFVGFWIGTILFDIIRLTNSFGLAMGPNDGHASFWFAYMANFVREIRIQLMIAMTGTIGSDGRVGLVIPTEVYENQEVSISVYT